MKLKVKYIDNNLTKMEKIKKGDLIDLRVSKVKINGETIEFDGQPIYYRAGDFVFVKLGFAMEMPKGYKANVYPRSSTFKNYGLILTNSVGQIDGSYCGDTDEWAGMFYALKDGKLEYNDRILQFEVVKSTINDFDIEFVERLENNIRGGYGSTGTK